MTPTKQQFGSFEKAYNYFNRKLFSSKLPKVILNLSRKSKSMGFVAPNRWEDKAQANKHHELSINPSILHLSLVEIYSTLVHEQCHIWQITYGTPSRGGYHNKEFAAKMIEVGLMPSTTGKAGGKTTGQNMSDYPIKGGRFLTVLESMPENFKLPFTSREGVKQQTTSANQNNGSATAETAESGEEKEKPRSKNKTKFTCPKCKSNAWGKGSLNIECGLCKIPFVDADKLLGMLADDLEQNREQ